MVRSRQEQYCIYKSLVGSAVQVWSLWEWDGSRKEATKEATNDGLSLFQWSAAGRGDG